MEEGRVWAAIPAFNEAKRIQQVVSGALRYVDSVVVCDDGSRDQTGNLAASSGAIVIKHRSNRGKGGALRSLFKFVRNIQATAAVTIDADGQHFSEDIPRVLNPVLSSNLDIVNGGRLGAVNEVPFQRQLGNRLLSLFTTAGTGIPVSDTQSGFRSYSRRALGKIVVTENGIGVDTQILFDAWMKGLSICEIPISVRYFPDERQSVIRQAIQVMYCIGKMRLLRRNGSLSDSFTSLQKETALYDSPSEPGRLKLERLENEE